VRKYVAEGIGWYGSFAALIAFAAITFGALTATSIWYQLLNLTGGAGIALISYKKKAWEPAASNALWTLIAAIALVRILL